MLGVFKRPATFIAVGVAALFFTVSIAVPAFGGPSALSAATALGTAKKALKTAKRADKRATRALKRAKTGPTGSQGSQGTQGPAGQTGTQGAAGTSRAWAHVFGNGTVDASKNMEVAREGTGQYCVKTPFTPEVLVVTPDWEPPGNRIAHANVTGFGSCATDLPGTNAFVVIHDGTGTIQDTEFFVMADGP